MKQLISNISIFTVLFLSMAVFSCEVSGVPACIQNEIKDFQKIEYLCDDAAVTSYLFQREVVYTFCHGLCISDGGCSVINANCENLGFLGGFARNIEINGEEFSDAVFIETIWGNQ